MIKNIFEHKFVTKFFTSETTQKNVNFFVTIGILFVLPVLIQNQLILGSIVNALLIRIGLKESREKLLVTAITPSLGAIVSGLLFGALTPFVIVMIPFIWFSNFVLAFLSKKFVERKQNYFKAVSIAVITKVSILLTTVIIFVQLAIVPKELLIIFGSTQIITGFIGAIIAYFSIK